MAHFAQSTIISAEGQSVSRPPLVSQNPHTEPVIVRVDLVLSPEDVARLDERAYESGMSRSDFVRKLVLA